MGQQGWVDRELGYMVGRAGGSCLPEASPKLPQSFPEIPKVSPVSPKTSQSLPKVSPELSPGYGEVPNGPQSEKGQKFRSRASQSETFSKTVAGIVVGALFSLIILLLRQFQRL